MRRYELKLPDELADAVAAKVAEDETTFHAVVRKLLAKWVGQPELKEARGPGRPKKAAGDHG